MSLYDSGMALKIKMVGKIRKIGNSYYFNVRKALADMLGLQDTYTVYFEAGPKERTNEDEKNANTKTNTNADAGPVNTINS